MASWEEIFESAALWSLRIAMEYQTQFEEPSYFSKYILCD